MSSPRLGSILALLVVSGIACSPDVSAPSSSQPSLDLRSQVSAWTARKVLPRAVRAAAGASDGQRVYVIGGSDAAGKTGFNQIYNPATNTWSRGANLPIRVDFAQAAALSDGIHLVSGNDSVGGLSGEHWVYNRTANTWTARASIPTPVRGAAAAVVAGKLYVIGGGANAGPSSAVQIFNPATNSWSSGSGMPTPRLSAAYAVLQGKIYVVGGQSFAFTTTDTAQRYDPVANSWQIIPSLPVLREALGGGTSGGNFCVFGGRLANPSPTGNAFPETYCYSPTTNTWTQGPNMLTPRVEPAFATFKGTIYALGGRTMTSIVVNRNESLH